jgi:hypothetical protein
MTNIGTIRGKDNYNNLFFRWFVLPNKIRKAKRIVKYEKGYGNFPKTIKNTDEVLKVLNWENGLWSSLFIRDFIANDNFSVKDCVKLLKSGLFK